jgi:hypothetical protein
MKNVFNEKISIFLEKLRKKTSIWISMFIFFIQSILFFIPSIGFADDNPFPHIDIGDGDVVQAIGSHIQTTLKYALVGGGGILICVTIAVLIHRLRDDSKDKDHTNLVSTFILSALTVTFGFILIAVGWKAFSTDIQ